MQALNTMQMGHWPSTSTDCLSCHSMSLRGSELELASSGGGAAGPCDCNVVQAEGFCHRAYVLDSEGVYLQGNHAPFQPLQRSDNPEKGTRAFQTVMHRCNVPWRVF